MAKKPVASERGRTLRVPATEISQGKGVRLYQFALDGKVVPSFAGVAQVRRNASGDLEGFQRLEVVSHITEIRDFVESEGAMIPNSIIMAFSPQIRFVPGRRPRGCPSYIRSGILVIPTLPSDSKDARPASVVDGQQRLAAVRSAKVKEFPLSIVGFFAEQEARTEQFILVNSTKPLPRSLIHEILPNTRTRMPTALQRKRAAAELLEELNRNPTSPLCGKVRTHTNRVGPIRDTSILQLLENSMSDGALFTFRGLPDSDRRKHMFDVVCAFFAAVKDVFPEAWSLPPKKSRLMHGAGIRSMGYLMDAIAHRRSLSQPTQAQFAADLRAIEKSCSWTSGYWQFGRGRRRRWNEIQNTSQDIQLLTDYLLGRYKLIASKITHMPNQRGSVHRTGRSELHASAV